MWLRSRHLMWALFFVWATVLGLTKDSWSWVIIPAFGVGCLFIAQEYITKHYPGFGPKLNWTLLALIFLYNAAIQFPLITDAVRQRKADIDKSAAGGIVGVTNEVQPTERMQCFDRAGKPLLWMYGDRNGRVVFYDRPGYHPVTGQQLRPVTGEVCEATIASLKAEAQARAAEQAGTQAGEAKRIEFEERQKIEFEAEPRSIHAGERATLRWRTRYASSVRVQVLGGAEVGSSLPNEGAVQVSPTADTTYEVVATGPEGERKAAVSVSVSPPSPAPAPSAAPLAPPPTMRVVLHPDRIELGMSSRITWRSENCTSVQIVGLGEFGPNSSKVVTPETAGSFQYALSCTGPGGKSEPQVVSVSVLPRAGPSGSLRTTPSAGIGTGKAGAIVMGSDQCRAGWTRDITVEELERALLRSTHLSPVLRSDLPTAVRQQLDRVSPNDRRQLFELARSANARYVVIGTCLEAREKQAGVAGLTDGRRSWDSAELRVVVRIQLLDERTGTIEASEGFDGQEYTSVLGGPHADGVQGAYRTLMARFAQEFVSRLRR